MQLVTTEDGSHTLYSDSVGECYHSQHGAVQESEHIFIKSGWEKCTRKDVNILEIGFGTGLNAFLTVLRAQKDKKHVHYTTIELFPVESNITDQLNYPEQVDINSTDLFRQLHTAEWQKPAAVTPYFTLEKINADFTTLDLTESYDLIYFDAFSPEKQAEMWTQECFEKIFAHANPEAILVTYCAKGYVRRALQAAGFTVERLQGPPGKREMLRAIKNSNG